MSQDQGLATDADGVFEGVAVGKSEITFSDGQVSLP